MTDVSDEMEPDDPERLAGTGDTQKQAWMETIEDMKTMAESRRRKGWDVVAVPSGHTAAVSRDAGTDDTFGLVHVIADNHADEFTEAFEAGEFPRYEAYRNEVDGFVYLLTELLDPESETAILIAGQYELRHAPGMVSAAKDEGALYTHVKTLDQTLLASFRHEEIDPLVPKADQLEEWGMRANADDE